MTTTEFQNLLYEMILSNSLEHGIADVATFDEMDTDELQGDGVVVRLKDGSLFELQITQSI